MEKCMKDINTDKKKCESIFLEKKMVLNKELTDEGMLAYVAIMSYTNKCRRPIELLLYDGLGYEVSEIVNNKNIIDAIKVGIKNLVDLDLIKVLSRNDRGLLTDVSSLYFSISKKDELFSYYLEIYREEVLKIINGGMKFKIKVLRYFICVMSTINHSSSFGDMNNRCNNVGNTTIQNLAEISQMSQESVMVYNKWLEENGLLFIQRSDKRLINTSGVIIKQFVNVYGRPSDQSTIINFQSKVEKRYENKNAKLQSNFTSGSLMTNNNRRITALLNQIKQGKEYPVPILEEVLQHCRDYNDNCIRGKKKQKYGIEDIEMLEGKIQQQDSAQELDDIFDDELDYRPEGKRKGEDSSVPQ